MPTAFLSLDNISDEHDSQRAIVLTLNDAALNRIKRAVVAAATVGALEIAFDADLVDGLSYEVISRGDLAQRPDFETAVFIDDDFLEDAEVTSTSIDRLDVTLVIRRRLAVDGPPSLGNHSVFIRIQETVSGNHHETDWAALTHFVTQLDIAA